MLEHPQPEVPDRALTSEELDMIALIATMYIEDVVARARILLSQNPSWIRKKTMLDVASEAEAIVYAPDPEWRIDSQVYIDE